MPTARPRRCLYQHPSPPPPLTRGLFTAHSGDAVAAARHVKAAQSRCRLRRALTSACGGGGGGGERTSDFMLVIRRAGRSSATAWHHAAAVPPPLAPRPTCPDPRAWGSTARHAQLGRDGGTCLRERCAPLLLSSSVMLLMWVRLLLIRRRAAATSTFVRARGGGGGLRKGSPGTRPHPPFLTRVFNEPGWT